MRFYISSLVFFTLIQYVYNLSPKPCDCGKENFGRRIAYDLEGRIVNGTEVIPHRYPWMASMRAFGNHICGGSIITDKNIITAGHCMKHSSIAKKSTWVVGAHSLDEFLNQRPYTYSTHYYQLHPSFRSGRYHDTYDISIVETDRRIHFSVTVAPICLPVIGDEEMFWNKDVTVIGWGTTSSGGESSDVLLETQVVLRTQKDCRDLAYGIEYDTKSMLCAHKKYTDSCQGDSGGPLFVAKEKNYNVLLGVVSFGKGCADSFPGVYAKIPEKETLGWIYNFIKASDARVCRNPAKRQFLHFLFNK